MAPLENVSAGNYTLDISFDGDENYTNSSFSKNITIKGEKVEDVIEDERVIEETLNDESYSSQQSYFQHTYSQSSQSSSQSSSDDSANVYIDENGNEMLAEYDENGKQIEPTE